MCTVGCAVSSNVYILVLVGEVSAHIELDPDSEDAST